MSKYDGVLQMSKLDRVKPFLVRKGVPSWDVSDDSVDAVRYAWGIDWAMGSDIIEGAANTKCSSCGRKLTDGECIKGCGATQ